MNEKNQSQEITLLDLPFKTNTCLDILKIGDNFTFKVTDSIDSKTITSTISRPFKTYFALNISFDEQVTIIGKTNSIYNFNTPVDFALPSSNAEFYYDFYNKLLSPNIEDVFELIDKKYNKLPLYLPPNLSYIPLFKSLPPKVIIEYKHKTKIVKFNWTDDIIPQEPNEEYYRYRKENDENFEAIYQYIQSILEAKPIVSKTERSFNPEKFSFKISRSHIVSYLPLLAYYTTKGPFSRCWIKFGYDPRKDQENYLYQRITKFKIKSSINFVYEDLELLKYIRENKKRFINDTFDHAYGWFKQEFITYAKRYYRGKIIDKMVQNNNEDDCFKTYF